MRTILINEINETGPSDSMSVLSGYDCLPVPIKGNDGKPKNKS